MYVGWMVEKLKLAIFYLDNKTQNYIKHCISKTFAYESILNYWPFNLNAYPHWPSYIIALHLDSFAKGKYCMYGIVKFI